MCNIFNTLSLLSKHSTFRFVYCIWLNNGYLGTYLQKNNKTTNQTKQAKNGKKRKKEDKKEWYKAGHEPGNLRLFATLLYNYTTKADYITLSKTL